MLISSQTDFLSSAYGDKEAVKILIESGYDAIDMSCFDMFSDDSPKLRPDYKEYAKELKRIADDAGVYFNQAHAPFPSSRGTDEFDKNAFDKIVRSMEFASLLGVRNIVVHPKQHLPYYDNVEYLKETNIEFYNSLIPYCKDFNIHVCMENMWQSKDGNICDSTCSQLKEFREYLDAVNSPWIKACLDIGHANLINADIPAFIKGLMPYLDALHMHDTCKNWDMHVLPYSIGTIKWDEVLKALAEAGYTGELTFEADNTLLHVPQELHRATAKYMATVGHELAAKFDSYKSNIK